MVQVEGGEIPEVQLLQLYLDVNQDIDTQFQVWISTRPASIAFFSRLCWR